MRPTRAAAALAAAATLALTLSACGTHPGEAATVGSSPIGTARLDRVASALCSAQARNQQPGQSQEQSSRSNRELALGVLIDSRLSTAYGEAHGIRPSQAQLNSAAANRQQLIASVPQQYRATLTATLAALDRSQLTMAEVGRRQLQQSGSTNITAQTAIPAGLKARNAWVTRHLDVSVDPRFGTFSNGQLKTGGGSLSTAVSTKAVDGARTQPPATWIASLPASQKCS